MECPVVFCVLVCCKLPHFRTHGTVSNCFTWLSVLIFNQIVDRKIVELKQLCVKTARNLAVGYRFTSGCATADSKWCVRATRSGGEPLYIVSVQKLLNCSVSLLSWNGAKVFLCYCTSYIWSNSMVSRFPYSPLLKRLSLVIMYQNKEKNSLTMSKCTVHR